MGLNMSSFNTVYKGRVFNTVTVMPCFDKMPTVGEELQPSSLEVWFVNEDGILTMIKDEPRKFRFVKKDN